MNKKIRICTEAPLIKYHQKRSNSCCLSSLASAFLCIGYNRAVSVLVNIIEESLTLQTETCRNIIHFSNYIMTNRIIIKGEQNLRYNMTIQKKNEYFGVLNEFGMKYSAGRPFKEHR